MVSLNIAIIAPETKPIPSVEGGAVETIIDRFIEKNEITIKDNIDIFARFDQQAYKIIEKFQYTTPRYIKLNYKNPSKITFINKLRTRVIKKKYLDHIIENVKDNYYDWLVIENRPEFVLPLKKAFPNTKIALHMHNEHLNVYTKNVHEIIEAVDKIISVSSYISEKIRKLDPNHNNKLHVLINKIDIKKFSPGIKDRELLDKYNLNDQNTILLFHGRLIKEKGIIELLKVFYKLNDKYSSLKLIILGELNTFDEDIKDTVELYLKKINRKNIVFTGYIDHKEIEKYLRLADIIILPSIWNEPLGLAMMESLAVGKPLVTTNVGGISEIVKNNCGVLINVDEYIVDHLFKKISELIEDRNLQTIYSKNARKQAVENFGDERFYEEFINILNS